MDGKHLDKPVYNHSYYKKLSIILTSFHVFSVHPTSVELEELIFKTYWKVT